MINFEQLLLLHQFNQIFKFMAKAKKTKAILCVDDDHIILGSLKIQLMQEFNEEFIIETAESGDEALEILDFLTERNINTLVVITDWLMPEMKGDELLVEINKQFPKVAKIMLSGQAEDEAIQNAFQEGNMQFFLSKPWDKKDLIEKIYQSLEMIA